MSAPNPGPGWREIDANAGPQPGEEFLHWAGGADGPFRRWVLTPPKPLPTAPGTVIRGSGGDAEGLWILDDAGWHRAGDTHLVPADVLQERIGGFEIVSAAPSATAALVLADVRSKLEVGATSSVILDQIAAQYGATAPTAPTA